MSKFQIITLCLFGAFVVGGLVTFSLYKGKSGPQAPTVVIWGTVDKAIIDKIGSSITKATDNAVHIQYYQKRDTTFNAEFVEALASGRGPDAVLISQDMITKNLNKIVPIPYDSYPEADFKSSFIQESELYLTPEGVIAVPFAVDPMVMYWNRDIFTNANIAEPPKYWEEFLTMAPAMTTRDQAGNITQSAVALGEYRNVAYAKSILSLLIMQAGNPIMVRTQTGLNAVLTTQFNNAISPADAALTFFTQFANPVKQVYSWNRSLVNSKNLFISNRLGIYFGYASEYNEIRLKNPNLNFSVTIVPQIKPSVNTTPVKMTFGKLFGLSIVRGTPDVANTVKALYLMAAKESNDLWSEESGLPSVRLDSLTPDPDSPVASTFSTSALWSKAWYDPDWQATEKIFQDMIESVTSGRQSHNNALLDAEDRLRKLIRD